MITQNQFNNLGLSLLNVDKCLVKNWNYRKVTSPFVRLYLITDGEGSIIYEHNKIELKKGWLYMIPGFALCNYSSKTFLEHFYVHFIPQFTGGTDLQKMLSFKYKLAATENDFRLFNRILELNPDKKLVNLDPKRYHINNLMPSGQSKVPVNRIAEFIETQGILMQLFSRFIITGSKKENGAGFTPNSKIKMVVEYIQKNLSQQHTLDKLAGICNFSNDYFSRLFLKTMGVRPIDYINRKRIEKAQLQLIVTNDPIAKIALDVGIDNLSYFNRLFTKYSCNAPGKYRKLHSFV